MSDEQRPRLRDLFRPRPESTDRTVTTEADDAVPIGLRVTAAYAWRLLLIAAVVAGIIWLVIELKLLVIPLMVGILITALLWPALQWMLRHRFPRWLAVAISIISTLAIVSLLLWLVIWQVRAQLPDVQERSSQAVAEFRTFLLEGPLHLSDSQIRATSIRVSRSSTSRRRRC
jgi:predicted PurR-regulated permease PerM